MMSLARQRDLEVWKLHEATSQGSSSISRAQHAPAPLSLAKAKPRHEDENEEQCEGDDFDFLFFKNCGIQLCSYNTLTIRLHK